MFRLSARGSEGREGLATALTRACRRFVGLFRREKIHLAMTPERMALLEAHGWEVYERAEPIREVPDVDLQPRPTRRNSKAGRRLVDEVQVSVLDECEPILGGRTTGGAE